MSKPIQLNSEAIASAGTSTSTGTTNTEIHAIPIKLSNGDIGADGTLYFSKTTSSGNEYAVYNFYIEGALPADEVPQGISEEIKITLKNNGTFEGQLPDAGGVLVNTNNYQFHFAFLQTVSSVPFTLHISGSVTPGGSKFYFTFRTTYIERDSQLKYIEPVPTGQS